MGREVPLTDIEILIGRCRDQSGTPLDLSPFPWLQERLSLFSRFLGFFGGTKRTTWQKKYLLPAIVEVSVPHLRRFFEGNWKAYDEIRLKRLFDFLGEHIGACKGSLPSDLFFFLAGPSPSFSHERERLHIRSREGMWRRDETHAEYKKRLQEFVQKGVEGRSTPSRPIAVQEELYTPTPICQRTKERLDLLLEKLHTLREKCVGCSFQLEKDFTKVFPLRCDFSQLVVALQDEKETLFTILLDVENEIAKLSEMHVVADDERARPLIERNNRLYQEFLGDLERIEKGLQVLRTQAEEARSFLQKRLTGITRSIDHLSMLPLTNPFKSSQARIIRMAREKLKKFRESLGRGPGPGFPVAKLEQEVLFLIKLSQEFCEEGLEVSTMRESLLHLADRVKQAAEQKSGPKKKVLLEILSEINALQSTLEVSSDRKVHMDRIVAALSEVGFVAQ